MTQPTAKTPTPPLHIKGGSLRSKLAYVSRELGEAAASELEAALATRGVTPILEASWYDYEHFDYLLRQIADRHFGGDLARLRDVGRYSARHALTTTYELYAARGDLHAFLSRLSKLHGQFYSRGQLTVLERGDTSCRMMLHGAGFYCEPDLQVAAGFFAGAAEHLGCRDVRCAFTAGEDRVELVLSWS